MNASVASKLSRSGASGSTLVQSAIDAVTGYIRDNKLRVGDFLPGEAYFADTLGVSRAVMREAFGALSALRLIDVANGRKPKVGALDGAVMAASLDHAMTTAQISVSDVWDVRRTIEQRTVFLAAQSRTARQAEEIVQLAEAMAASQDDFAEMTKNDIAFHYAIARASGNPLFVQIVSSFAPLMEVAIPTAWKTRKAKKAKQMMIDRHHAVAQAIMEQDCNGAAIAMDAHFDASVGMQLDVVGQSHE